MLEEAETQSIMSVQLGLNESLIKAITCRKAQKSWSTGTRKAIKIEKKLGALELWDIIKTIFEL